MVGIIMSASSTQRQTEEGQPEPLPLAAIEAAIRAVRHGVVQVIIQDGRVVQIEKTEKIRLESSRTRGR
jgi:hypothetical protein